MIDPKQLYVVNPEVAFSSTNGGYLIHEFVGFVDAGRVIESISETLLTLDHEVVAEFDIDELHDFRSRRPLLTFEDYSWTSVGEIRIVLYRCLDSEGRPFFLLTGPEPDMKWNAMAQAVLGLANQLGVSGLVTGSAIPMTVPHTRPIIITAHGNRGQFTAGNRYVFDQSIKMPGSFSAFLEYQAGREDLAAFGFAAHVPHYFGQVKFPTAAIEVLSQISAATGLKFPLNDLMQEAAEHVEQVNKEMAEAGDVAEMLSALEESYDELAKNAVPSLDEIGRAVEMFLKEQDGKDS